MYHYFKELLAAQKAIRASLWRLSIKPKGKVKFKGEFMADVLTYKLTMNEVSVDVETQELSVVVDGGDPEVHVVEASVSVVEFSVPQDSKVDLSLIYVDDAGNKSEPAMMSFIAEDTLPPEMPDTVGVVELVSEEDA